MSKKMKEELTTEMHNEFTVSRNTEIKHIAFCALGIYGASGDLNLVLRCYSVTKEQLIEHLPEYNRLKGSNLEII